MTVLIAGAGIGGLALGTALARFGVESEIYEAWADPGHGAGAFLNVAPNGTKALAQLGVVDEALEVGFPSTGIEFYNHRRRRIGYLDSTKERERYGASNIMIRRTDLHKVLYRRAEAAGVKVHWGQRLEEVLERRGEVETRFGSGQCAVGSVVVGADGVHSQVREHVAGRSEPQYLGLVDIAGFSPTAPSGIPVGPQRMIFGRLAFFSYYITPAGETWWFCNIPFPRCPSREQLTQLARETWSERLSGLHAADPGEIAEILGDTEPPVGAWPLTDLSPLRTWHTNRVCLLGDAAHATSPSAGQGASLALEDAVVLARHIGLRGPTAGAFAAFEGERRERVESLIRMARRNSNTKVSGRVGRLLRDLALPVFLRAGADAIGREAYSYQLPALP